MAIARVTERCRHAKRDKRRAPCGSSVARENQDAPKPFPGSFTKRQKARGPYRLVLAGSLQNFRRAARGDSPRETLQGKGTSSTCEGTPHSLTHKKSGFGEAFLLHTEATHAFSRLSGS